MKFMKESKARFLLVLLSVLFMLLTSFSVLNGKTEQKSASTSEPHPVPRYTRLGNGDSAYLKFSDVRRCAEYIKIAMVIVPHREEHNKDEMLDAIDSYYSNPDNHIPPDIDQAIAEGIIKFLWRGGPGNFMVDAKENSIQAYYVSLLFNRCLDETASS